MHEETCRWSCTLRSGNCLITTTHTLPMIGLNSIDSIKKNHGTMAKNGGCDRYIALRNRRRSSTLSRWGQVVTFATLYCDERSCSALFQRCRDWFVCVLGELWRLWSTGLSLEFLSCVCQLLPNSLSPSRSVCYRTACFPLRVIHVIFVVLTSVLQHMVDTLTCMCIHCLLLLHL